MIVIENTFRPDLSDVEASERYPELEREKLRKQLENMGEFEEMEVFKAAFPEMLHVQVNEVTTQSINDVYNAILSTAHEFKIDSQDLISEEEMMSKIKNSNHCYYKFSKSTEASQGPQINIDFNAKTHAKIEKYYDRLDYKKKDEPRKCNIF